MARDPGWVCPSAGGRSHGGEEPDGWGWYLPRGLVGYTPGPKRVTRAATSPVRASPAAGLGALIVGSSVGRYSRLTRGAPGVGTRSYLLALVLRAELTNPPDPVELSPDGIVEAFVARPQVAPESEGQG